MQSLGESWKGRGRFYRLVGRNRPCRSLEFSPGWRQTSVSSSRSLTSFLALSNCLPLSSTFLSSSLEFSTFPTLTNWLNSDDPSLSLSSQALVNAGDLPSQRGPEPLNSFPLRLGTLGQAAPRQPDFTKLEFSLNAQHLTLRWFPWYLEYTLDSRKAVFSLGVLAQQFTCSFQSETQQSTLLPKSSINKWVGDPSKKSTPSAASVAVKLSTQIASCEVNLFSMEIELLTLREKKIIYGWARNVSSTLILNTHMNRVALVSNQPTAPVPKALFYTDVLQPPNSKLGIKMCQQSLWVLFIIISISATVRARLC